MNEKSIYKASCEQIAGQYFRGLTIVYNEIFLPPVEIGSFHMEKFVRRN